MGKWIERVLGTYMSPEEIKKIQDMSHGKYACTVIGLILNILFLLALVIALV